MKLKLDPEIFNEAYLPHLFNYEKRKECYYGSAGSGKSVFVGQKLIVKGLNKKRKILVIRKIGATQKDSCFQLIKDVLQQFKIYDQCKVNKTDLTIELPNGSLFLFKGLDDPEKIKSITGITDIWCEEATELTLDDVTQLDLRLRARADDLQIIFSFNPTSKSNWVYTYFGFDIEKVPDNSMVLKTTYKDNKFLPQEYIDSLLAMKETNPTYYKIYVEGDFATLDKLIFPHYTVMDFDWKEKLNSGNRTFLALGCDFGYQDPTAFIASVVDDTEKVLYIFDEHYERGMLNTDIARMILKKGFRKERIFFDCAEPKSIQELKRNGIDRATPCKKGKDSIKHGIQKVLQYKIIVHSSCVHTVDEFNNYCYKKNKSTGEYTNEPLDNGWCHLMDALRYSMQIVKKKAKFIDIKL